MSELKTLVVTQLKRVKGPDLESNIVDLGLVSGRQRRRVEPQELLDERDESLNEAHLLFLP